MNNIAAALSKAQASMGKALKQTSNPHLRMKYADLSSVMEACMPALSEQGIAVIQPPGEDSSGQFAETIFIHAESGEQLSCRIPLIVNKNDMQGYGSAITYARRYGLMAMAGIAPEDDDGNAAAMSAPKLKAPSKITENQFQKIKALIEITSTNEAQVCQFVGVKELIEMDESKANDVIALLNKKQTKMSEEHDAAVKEEANGAA